MVIFTTVATIVGCITACMGLAVAIIKPFRKWIIDSFVRQSQAKEVQTKIDNMVAMMNKSLDNDAEFEKRLLRVEQNVLENEADRLRSELFDCGNRCRRGIRLHPEEMEHIRVVFTKYSQKLKQNGTGEAEYNFICEYYNHQDFPEYHTHNLQDKVIKRRHIMEFIQEILFAIIAAAVPVATTFLCRWLVSLYETNKVKIKNEIAQNTIGLVTDMIVAAVETTTSTYVKQLKAENLFNAEAQKEAFNMTFEAVKKQLTEDSEKIITELYGDVETYITNKIEQFVEELKHK